MILPLQALAEQKAILLRHYTAIRAHFGEQLKIVYDDPDGHDKLYRFMESIQEFFDLSSKLEVSFN